MWCKACGGSGKHRLMCPAANATTSKSSTHVKCACGLTDALKRPADKHSPQECFLDDGGMGNGVVIKPGDLAI